MPLGQHPPGRQLVVGRVEADDRLVDVGVGVDDQHPCVHVAPRPLSAVFLII
jgi:hypothetical protein